MTRTRTFTLAAVLLLGITAAALTAPGDRAGLATPVGDYTVDHCIVSAIQDIEFPAEDPGLLVAVHAKEGDLVAQGDPLAQLDDTEARAQRAIAEHNAAAARGKAESEIPILYAQKAADVSEKELEIGKLANQRNPGTVSAMEMERRQLDWERALAQIDQEKLNKELAQYDMQAREEEAKLAEKAILRRQLAAPFTGEVVQVYRHANEWVRQGDPILRFMQRDQMKVRGAVDASLYNPDQLAGRRVTVEYTRARGEPIQFQGEIRYISQLIDGINNVFEVEAIVDNRRLADRWILPHGARVRMTVHVGNQ